MFANADFTRNLTIYITLATATLLYLVLLVYARRKDKRDADKLGVTPLADNAPGDEHVYQLIVFTGHRQHAGTTSQVGPSLSL